MFKLGNYGADRPCKACEHDRDHPKPTKSTFQPTHPSTAWLRAHLAALGCAQCSFREPGCLDHCSVNLTSCDVLVERYAVKTVTVTELKATTAELEKTALVLCANCQRLLKEWLVDPGNRLKKDQLAAIGMHPVIFLKQQREAREALFPTISRAYPVDTLETVSFFK